MYPAFKKRLHLYQYSLSITLLIWAVTSLHEALLPVLFQTECKCWIMIKSPRLFVTCHSVDLERTWPIFCYFYMEHRAWEIRSVPVPYFSSLLWWCICRVLATDICCIYACFDYRFPDFAEISWLVHFVLVFSSKHVDRSRSQLRNCC